MELTDLNPGERLALVALMQKIVIADGRPTEDEGEEIGAVATALGEAEYRTLLEVASDKYQDGDALRACVQAVVRPDAQEVIYATVLQTALSGGVEQQESEILTWLETAWDVKAQAGADADLDADRTPT